ncbi:hypothetical protein LM596_05395 [Liquorilactobacillus mali]|uniref:hypothetical protein n=1 Tax=Liquorilactobacillus mali TaxID=1618 RepID=UPI0012622010|nr:hypothetical protein [Liquorilactobacillus mali]QFQ74584.1 hypothetical protein LM596_05395 [Liquorilactobacillus mali]
MGIFNNPPSGFQNGEFWVWLLNTISAANGETEAINQRINNGGASAQSDEVSNARTDAHGYNYGSLAPRIDATQIEAENALAQVSSKANAKDVQEMIAMIMSASPRDVLSSVDEMTTKYPKGTDSSGSYLIIVNSTDGYWYYWNGASWTKGTQFLTPEDSTTVTALKALLFDMTPYAYGWIEHFGTNTRNVIDQSALVSGYFNSDGQQTSTSWEHSPLLYLEASKITVYTVSSTYVTFFDKAKTFIANQTLTGLSDSTPGYQTLTAPTNAAFFAINVLAAQAGTLTCTFGNVGTTITTAATTIGIKRNLFMPSTVVVVDPNPARGDFQTISDAVSIVPDGYTLLIMPGTYSENLHLAARNLNLIGTNKENTIILSTSNSRSNPPLEACAGYFKNLTFYAQRPANAADTSAMPYGAHIDFDNEANQSLVFENCAFKSDWNAGVGVGMRAGFKLAFKRCDIVSTYADQGALFFHDSTNSDLAGYYQLKIDDCDITAAGKYAIIAMGIGLSGNNLDLVATRNSLWSDTNGKGNDAIGTQQPDSTKYPISTGTGFGGTATIKLNGRSFGNSADSLNS